MIYLNQNFDMLYLGCFSINWEQNDKMSHRKAFGFKSMSEHVVNFVLVKKYFYTTTAIMLARYVTHMNT